VASVIQSLTEIKLMKIQKRKRSKKYKKPILRKDFTIRNDPLHELGKREMRVVGEES